MQLSDRTLELMDQALHQPVGWWDLGAVALCLIAAWWVDHRVRLRTEHLQGVVRVGAGSVNRVIFPLAALALLFLARAIFQHWRPPLFLPLAIPLLLSLAAIRIVVYVLRTLFAPSFGLVVSERVISFAIWILLILHYVGVLEDIQQAMQDISFPLGQARFNLWQASSGLLLVVLTLFVSLWLSSLIEGRLMAAQLDMSLRVVLGKFTRALLLFVGVLVALSVAGIDITVLSVFGGALGVGIGLGLQKIASNYIAGFTILLDRSVRLGDVITVDNRYGVVTALTARYVLLRGLDGIESIIPNETLVTTSVLNHSHSGKEVRLALAFSVAYDTDLDLAMRLLAEAATAHPRALQDRFAPQAYVAKFGESGIDLELGVWIKDPEQGRLNVTSDINLAVWKAFSRHGVRIPFPQREVRLLSGAQENPAA